MYTETIVAHLNIAYSPPFMGSEQSALVANITADGAEIWKMGSYTGNNPFASVRHGWFLPVCARCSRELIRDIGSLALGGSPRHGKELR